MRKFSASDKCMKCRYYCKRFVTFLFSHIGLCGLVVCYVILGAIIFSSMEKGREKKTKLDVQQLHNTTVNAIWNMTRDDGSTRDPFVQEFPPQNDVPDVATIQAQNRRQLDQLRRDATLDLWNITLEMNVLFEKNWTSLVNERILAYQNQLFMLLNDTLRPNSSTIQPDYYEPNNESTGREGIRVRLLHFEKDLLQEVRQNGYDGDFESEQLQWSIAGGLLYSLTVITTIGYGHITPKTWYGRMVTMVYAIVGIPLMLLCLANIGDALAHAFKFFYWKVCCLYCEIKKRRQRLMRIQSVRMSRKSNRSPASMPNNIGGLNSMHSSFKARSILEKPTELALPNTHGETLIKISTPSPTLDEKSLENASGNSPEVSTEVATTSNDASNNNSGIGSESGKPPLAVDDDLDNDEGVNTAGSNEERLMIAIPQDTGKRKMSVCNMPPETIDGIDYVDETPQPSPTHLSPDETTAVMVHDVEDDDDQMSHDFQPRYEKQSVPVYVCLLVVAGYIGGGSVLFATWEGWTLVEGAYFCFITLTTIGFGDFVPGVSATGESTTNSETKLTLCSLYLVFGMALLAMSFNLVQEAATEKAKWIARKIGLLSDDSEEED